MVVPSSQLARRPRCARGFTLLELLLVVLLLGLLLALVTLRVHTMRAKAAETGMNGDLKQYALAEEVARHEGLGFVLPDSLRALGFAFSAATNVVAATAGEDYWYVRIASDWSSVQCEASSAEGDYRAHCGEQLSHPSPVAEVAITLPAAPVSGAAHTAAARTAAASAKATTRAATTANAAMSSPSGAVYVSHDTTATTMASRVVLEGITLDAAPSYDPAGDRLVEYQWALLADSAGASWARVRVQARWGTRATVQKKVGVPNDAPLANFVVNPTEPAARVAATFDASSSHDTDGTVVGASWNFGDGSTGQGLTTTHTYGLQGTYPVTLTVVDDGGASTTTTQFVIVGPRPAAALTATPSPALVGDTVHFDGRASTTVASATIVAYAWDFGDFTTGAVEGAEATHVFPAAGTYTVALIVTDSRGIQDTATATLTVRDRPQAVFQVVPSTAQVAGTTLAFDGGASTATPGGQLVGFAWSFGDWTPVDQTSGSIAHHAYAGAGTYTAMLVVTDETGLADTATQTVTVLKPNVAPTAALTVTPTSAQVKDTIVADARASSDPDGTIATWRIDFGDGVVATTSTAKHAYLTAGTFTVRVTVTDNQGATASTAQAVTIAPLQPPVAAFTVTPDTLFAYDHDTLDASASSSPNGTIANWAWDFGDGSTGTGKVITKAWADSGTYTVRLTVTDTKGATASTTHQVRVVKQWLTDPNPWVCDEWSLQNAQCLGGGSIEFFDHNSMIFMTIPGAPAGDASGPATYTHPMSHNLQTYWVDKTVNGVTVRFQITATTSSPTGTKMTLSLDWQPHCAGCSTQDFTVQVQAYDAQNNKIDITLQIYSAYLYQVAP